MITILLIIAIAILCVPLLKNKSTPKKYFIYSGLFIILFSVGLYYFTTDFSALKLWETQGKAHYQLLVDYQKLGGLDGMIQKVRAKLKTNSNDAQGWFILGKLYLMKNDYPHAKAALSKARRLSSTKTSN